MKFMDENASSFSPSYSQSQSPKIYINRQAGSGLTLVIPSLKSLKANKTPAPPNPPPPIYHDIDTAEKRAPRPVKLKPLKEVLTKLISQIKKKDDYAFFLHPVDVANVPGYLDVVKRPMDLGTMTDKVVRGRYRSLEDFASDLKLVTNNAKLFNPPGSIYYTEADRLEHWALEHISKAASTVIQYETDWNIEIEKDDDGPPVNVDDDEDYPSGTPMDVDGAQLGTATSLRERSMSSQPQPGPSRRGPRGPYKKHAPSTGITETLEPDGGLPGSKDGLGSFPPGSDWARTMLMLKRKGKRYKTKKERLRIEREGPPLLPDGSLDYTEMEDPFSVLSFFVPDPPSRPHLVSLYPPLFNTQESSQQQVQDQSQPQTHPPQTPVVNPNQNQPQTQTQSSTPAPPSTPAPVPTPAFTSVTVLPPDHKFADLPFLRTLKSSQTNGLNTPAPITGNAHQQPYQPLQMQQQASHTQQRRKHWTIARNPGTYRSKGKEREDDVLMGGGAWWGAHFAAGLGEDIDIPAWRMPRPAGAFDFGSFAPLAGALAEEMHRRGMDGTASAGAVNGSATVHVDAATGVSNTTPDVDKEKEKEAARQEQQAIEALIRERLNCEKALAKMPPAVDAQKQAQIHAQPQGIEAEIDALLASYWTPQRAAEAEDYVRDIVYGGVEGLAYVRSLAEFVDGDLYYKKGEEDEGELQTDMDVDEENKEEAQQNADNTEDAKRAPKATIPLAEWVATHIVDPLTDGRHALLRATARELFAQCPSRRALTSTDPREGTVASQVAASLRLAPLAHAARAALLQVRAQKIDMGALIRAPAELFLSEEEWVGKSLKEKRRAEVVKKLQAEITGISAPESGNTQEGSVQPTPAPTSTSTTAPVTQPPAPIPAGLDPTALKERLSGRLSTYEQEGPAELNEVLEHVANLIAELDKRTREKQGAGMKSEDSTMDDGTEAEDPALRNLRLNLLALAKRAPLDTIARLPKDLVPEHIRHFVPTLGSTA